MSKRRIPESHTAHPNVTPLIDIIMCLIIFFMLVAKIGVDTGAMKIDIPPTALGTKIKDMGNTLVLNIPEGNGDDPDVEAMITPPGGGPAHLTHLSLHDAAGQNVLQNTLAMYKGQKDDFKVIIRAKADLQWRFISPVLDTCNDAGVRTIEYNTKTADAPGREGGEGWKFEVGSWKLRQVVPFQTPAVDFQLPTSNQLTKAHPCDSKVPSRSTTTAART